MSYNIGLEMILASKRNFPKFLKLERCCDVVAIKVLGKVCGIVSTDCNHASFTRPAGIPDDIAHRGINAIMRALGFPSIGLDWTICGQNIPIGQEMVFDLRRRKLGFRLDNGACKWYKVK